MDEWLKLSDRNNRISQSFLIFIRALLTSNNATQLLNLYVAVIFNMRIRSKLTIEWWMQEILPRSRKVIRRIRQHHHKDHLGIDGSNPFLMDEELVITSQIQITNSRFMVILNSMA
jgi:hypothetical protein